MKTMVVGASDNPERYAYKAAKRLIEHGHEVVLVGNKKMDVLNHPILNIAEVDEAIDTVTMYVGPTNQAHYIDEIIRINPRRVIFNPGTENPDFEHLLDTKGIAHEEACTLVLLGTNQY